MRFNLHIFNIHIEPHYRDFFDGGHSNEKENS